MALGLDVDQLDGSTLFNLEQYTSQVIAVRPRRGPLQGFGFSNPKAAL